MQHLHIARSLAGPWGPTQDPKVTSTKMIISRTPISLPVTSPEFPANGLLLFRLAAVLSRPCRSRRFDGMLAFYGGGSSGQQGIYSMTRGSQTIARIADLNTPIPNGSGTFYPLALRRNNYRW
jgi:hypothetical protein